MLSYTTHLVIARPSRVMPRASNHPRCHDWDGKGTIEDSQICDEWPLQLRAAWESPWGKYEGVYDVELGGTVEVAARKASPVELVHVRAFSTEAPAKKLHLFRQLRHQNIVTAVEAFTTDNGLYIFLEHMPVSLERIVRSPAYPDERQLAAILGQVSFRNPFKNIH